ncbi:MAG: glycosyltransferase family 4 protein [Symploca sp. SIO1C4]|uniref:Glycosyltransferase family 4 protein n=1 Tax=Symploca sp. SIO1C4 TaxID=2607765 RepID=A0A6B3NIB9_9CYAN|nr:glycosyltransferase family 4 protein [Symploca sp. SIO1C4]
MKSIFRKPRICIALPGVQYQPHSPYILSTLPMVPFLEKDFDVTLVYRKILNTNEDDHIDHKYLTLVDQNQMSEREKHNRFPYYVPNHYLSLWNYKRIIDKFAQEHAKKFDLIIEKEWPLLGIFASAFSRYQVPTVILIEAMYKYRKLQQPNLLKQLASIGLEQLRPQLRKQWSDRTDSIVVETEQMKSFLLENGYVRPNQPIYPIPYGVDPDTFSIRERRFCREQLGISQEALVLTYVGSLNRFIQEPGPIIEALGREQPQGVVLYMVGDGSKHEELEALAKELNAPVVFTGRLPQKEAALYISAANLCVAPYNKYLYLQDKFTCASLKVPEYLSCGRAVLTIPCERMEHLLAGQKYGFLVNNQVDSYREFLRNLPSKEKLSIIEQDIIKDMENFSLRAQRILLRWWDIAKMYKNVIEETISRK